MSKNIKIHLKLKSSEETFNSINHFPFEKFPDNTRQIQIALNYQSVKKAELELSIILYFSVEKYSNGIDFKIQAANGKMIISQFTKDLQHIINSKRTLNYFFYPSNIIYLILVLATLLPIPLSFIFFDNQPKLKIQILTLCATLIIYLFLLPQLKPYSSFDTSIQKRNDMIVNFIILAILTYVISEIFIPFLL